MTNCEGQPLPHYLHIVSHITKQWMIYQLFLMSVPMSLAHRLNAALPEADGLYNPTSEHVATT